MTERKNPWFVLDDCLERLRVELIREYGSPNDVPERIREVYLGTSIAMQALGASYGVVLEREPQVLRKVMRA